MRSDIKVALHHWLWCQTHVSCLKPSAVYSLFPLQSKNRFDYIWGTTNYHSTGRNRADFGLAMTPRNLPPGDVYGKHIFPRRCNQSKGILRASPDRPLRSEGCSDCRTYVPFDSILFCSPYVTRDVAQLSQTAVLGLASCRPRVKLWLLQDRALNFASVARVHMLWSSRVPETRVCDSRISQVCEERSARL